MADFSINATNLSAPQGAGSSPVPAVQRAGNASIIPSELLSLGIKAGEAYAKQSQANDSAGVLGLYQKQLAGVASALQGGHIGEKEALIRTQKISNDFAASYAADGGETLKAMSGIRKEMFALTSLKFADEAQEDNRAAKKGAREDAIKKGILNPFAAGVTPELEAAAVELSQSMVRAEDENQRQIRMNSESRAQESHIWQRDRTERENIDYVRKEGARNALNSVKTSAIGYTESGINALRSQIQNGLPFEQAEIATKRLISSMSSQVQEALRDSPESAKIITDQLAALEQASIQDLDPRKRSELTTATYNEMLNRTKIALMSNDPNIQVLAATNSMLPNLPVEAVVANRAVISVFKSVQDGTYSGILLGNDTASQRTIYKGVQDTVNKAVSGRAPTGPEKSMADAGAVVNSLTREASKVSPGDPASLRTYTQFMATPEVAKLVESGQLDKQTAVMARTAWASTYQRDALMSLTPRLNAPLGAAVVEGGASVQPTLANVADFEMRGNELIMVDKPSREMFASPQLIRARANEVRDVMKEINTIIRAGAHLEGTTDYAAYWEKNKHLIMPDFFVAPEREAEAKAQGYLGGNRRNPANWRKPDNGGATSNSDE